MQFGIQWRFVYIDYQIPLSVTINKNSVFIIKNAKTNTQAPTYKIKSMYIKILY